MHAALAWALLTGLGVDLVVRPERALAVFDVAPPTPPPASLPAPLRAAVPKAAGRAAPPALRAVPKPVVAPPPRISLDPPPVLAAPVAGAGDQTTAGAAPVPGPGTGAGGLGIGLGAGGRGDGTGGGGGLAVPARRVAGEITHGDYPRAAVRARAGGEVTVRLEIGADGRVADCLVQRSSGHPELDATTCRLARARFRYRPARDAQGRAIPDVRGWRQSWWLERP